MHVSLQHGAQPGWAGWTWKRPRPGLATPATATALFTSSRRWCRACSHWQSANGHSGSILCTCWARHHSGCSQSLLHQARIGCRWWARNLLACRRRARESGVSAAVAGWLTAAFTLSANQAIASAANNGRDKMLRCIVHQPLTAQRWQAAWRCCPSPVALSAGACERRRQPAGGVGSVSALSR